MLIREKTTQKETIRKALEENGRKIFANDSILAFNHKWQHNLSGLIEYLAGIRSEV